MSVVGAIAELFTVGAVVPLLVAAANPNRLKEIPVVGSKINELAAWSGIDALILCAIILSSFALVAAIFRLLVLWLSQRIIYDLHKKIVMEMHEGVLFQDYEWFALNNSSDFIATIEKVSSLAGNLFVSLIGSIPALFMCAAILTVLVFINFMVAIGIIATLGVLYAALAYFSLGSVHQISRSAAVNRDRRLRFAQETWGAARDIIIDRTQLAYLTEAAKLENHFANLHVRAGLVGLAPRIIIDASIIILISAIIILLAGTPSQLLASLPLLGAFAIGGQRLIPLLQHIYLTYANQKIYSAYIDDALKYTELRSARVERPPTEVSFKKGIELRDVSLTYRDGKIALRHINLDIPKGSRLGIAGKTGSGKSTLADVIMGLLTPSGGVIAIDGIALTPAAMGAWHARIAHVPQSIFLADDTLLSNIVFAAREQPVDMDRAVETCLQAGLADVIGEHGKALSSRIGEGGVRLSGGQRQRIGIARALYKGADVLVLDEATSALDLDTEAEILKSVFALHKDVTIIMISHRPVALELCSQVVMMENGEIASN